MYVAPGLSRSDQMDTHGARPPVFAPPRPNALLCTIWTLERSGRYPGAATVGFELNRYPRGAN